jgi:hypothetical protein
LRFSFIHNHDPKLTGWSSAGRHRLRALRDFSQIASTWAIVKNDRPFRWLVPRMQCDTQDRPSPVSFAN